MNKLISKIVLICLLLFSFTMVFSQTHPDTLKQSPTVIVKMKNGVEYRGQILKQDNKTIVLKTVNGEINLIASKISSIENIDYEGKFEFAHPHDTRYFIGPSAIPLKKGKGYYQNVSITLNSVHYGITKNISIGGGFEFISTVAGTPLWFLTPKAGFKVSENLHIGGGLFIVGVASEGAVALGYGVFTLGSSETNLSVGAGYSLIEGGIADNPAIMISGTHRVSESIALLSENHLIPNTFGDGLYYGIHGIRILSDKNAFDVGLIIIPLIADFIPAFPHAGYAREF